MSLSCGVDIVDTARIKLNIDNSGHLFVNKVYTNKEIEYCESKKAARILSYAARFAAKEAVSKAFGTGIQDGISWTDIEVLNDEKGKPYVVLHGKAREKFNDRKGLSISLSLSHCKEYAVAYAILETP